MNSMKTKKADAPKSSEKKSTKELKPSKDAQKASRDEKALQKKAAKEAKKQEKEAQKLAKKQEKEEKKQAQKKEKDERKEGEKEKEKLKGQVNENSSPDQVSDSLKQEKGFWNKFKSIFTKKNAGIVWKRVLNITRALGISGPLEIIESIIGIVKGDGADFKTFFSTVWGGLKGGVSNFLHNIIGNLLKIGAGLINTVLPDDCQLESLNLASMVKFLIHFVKAEKVVSIIRAIVKAKPAGIKDVFMMVMECVGKSLIRVIQPSNLIKAVGGSLFSMLMDNPIVGMVTKYLGHACEFVGGTVNCVAAAMDGSVDFIANAVENAICKIPELILEIVVDCTNPGFLDTIKSGIEMVREFVTFGGLFEKFSDAIGLSDVDILGDAMNDAMEPAFMAEDDDTKKEDNKGSSESESPAQKQEGGKKQGFFGRIFSGGKKAAKKAKDEIKEGMKDDDLVKAAMGIDLKEDKAQEKAEKMKTADHYVEYVVAGGQLPEIATDAIPEAMRPSKTFSFKAQKAHIAHYVVYNSAKAPIYRTPVPDRAEEAIREAEGRNKSDLKDNIIAQFLGVDAHELGNQDGKDRSAWDYALNATLATLDKATEADDDD